MFHYLTLYLSCYLPFSVASAGLVDDFPLQSANPSSHSLALFGETPFPALPESHVSIGQYMAENPPKYNVHSEDSSLQSCTGNLHDVDVLRYNSFGMCALTPKVTAARWLAYEAAGGSRTTVYTPFFGRTYSALVPYDDTESFTIVLPAGTCAQTVLGDFEDPVTGIIEHNAIFSSVYQSLIALDQNALFKYTVSVLEQRIASLTAALQPVVCRGSGRGLLWWRMQYITPQNVTGNIFYKLVSVLGGVGIAYGVNVGPIAHTGPFAHVSPLG